MADTIDPASSNLNPIFGDYVMNMLGQGQALGQLPYQPYTGQIQADPTQLMQQYYSGIGGLQTPQSFGQAQGAYGQAQNMLGNNQNVTAQQLGPQLDASNTGTVQSFMNPYTQSVTNIAKDEASRASTIQGNQLDANAVKAGAFGGSRQGLEQAERMRNLNQQLNSIQATGDQNAFNNAQTALNNQRNASIQTGTTNAQLGLQAGIANQNAGLQGASTMSNIGSGLASLGNAENNANVSNLNTLGTGANVQQTAAQNPLNFGYQQWQDSLKYPWQQVQNQSGILSGLPLQVQQQQSTNPTIDALNAFGSIYDIFSKP